MLYMLLIFCIPFIDNQRQGTINKVPLFQLSEMPVIIYRFAGKVSYVTGVILLDDNLEKNCS